MAGIEERIQLLGLALPAPLQLPPGAVLPFPWVRIVGSRALISGHGPTNPDGSLAQPLGKVGAQVTPEQAYVAARLTGLAILASLKREIGSLDRIACWTRACSHFFDRCVASQKGQVLGAAVQPHLTCGQPP